MYLSWDDLPADAEPVHYKGSGSGTTAYKVPIAEVGPVLREYRSGLVVRQVLVYMLGHFVFTWHAGEARVTIEHGDIGGKNNMPLPWTLTIRDEWTHSNLTNAARKWRAAHMKRCGVGRGQP